MRITKTTVSALAVLALVACLLPAWGALTSSVQVTVGHTHTSSSGLGTANDTLGYAVTKTFPNGSGTAQVADLVYHASRNLSSGADETLDFYGGLLDAFGNTINAARLKAITIENTSGSMTITIGNAAAPIAIFDPATATVNVPPYGVLTLVAPLEGWPVADTTADGIRVLNSGGDSTTYKIHAILSSN